MTKGPNKNVGASVHQRLLNIAFDGSSLFSAVQPTFIQRQTAMETEPLCFTERFAREFGKVAQWTSFTRRGLLTGAPTAFIEVVGRVRKFLQPVAIAISKNRSLTAHWPRGGPWVRVNCGFTCQQKTSCVSVSIASLT
jgi:hypothetical protein